MADPSRALHKAVLAALDSACSCDVWDGIPQGTSYPYVVMEYVMSDNEDFLSLNERMDLRYIFLTVWSRTHGQSEVLSIIEEIEALNEQPLTLDTGTMVSLRVDRKRTYREQDALTFQGQVVLRIITTHF